MWCAPLPTPGPAPDTAPARHAQSFGNSGHRQVADDDPDQTPPQAGAGDLGPRRRRSGGVVTPHVRALLAAVAAHGEHQRGRAPPERLVRQLPAHRVTGHALAAAPPAPVVRLHDPARQHGPVRLEQLAGDLQTEAVEAGEGSQVRAREGSVRHVEVFRTGCVRTPIIGRPRPSPRHRRAAPGRTTATPSSVKSPSRALRVAARCRLRRHP
ncbi:Hypothetical protein PFR_JS22-1_105 [Propionibacterium freudenreichii]|uniref:Uncharacterized protein n=1 Tax=Propionibacterium freudenreichii TaxID=1744 RepID=A0A2C7YUB2_9ACTN|nr:Hypothetical protein PFR_JS2_108 [Propionibacterium freudenreichii]SBW75753.1 Hypothetical protein PFR_JS22-1_105 [Propionibacterium freudenreichii]SCQ45054.1 Hypothetical protein PFR_JS7-1_104 [Propionibacterium freudenreichii]SCQ48774.1 Hypothetical protein PFR_JS7-2_104 [Propionibacterium freudenreichii]SCQ68970.1 Hypothetical protein PFR_JS15-1_2174 [Propionibacterium freudenreichii]